MLIYFLSIIPVLILSYGLVIEKSKTIEFRTERNSGAVHTLRLRAIPSSPLSKGSAPLC